MKLPAMYFSPVSWCSLVLGPHVLIRILLSNTKKKIYTKVHVVTLRKYHRL
jgi:hypothetical protein